MQITSVDVGNPARNVIPGKAQAQLNIRFNDLHNEASLTDWLTETLARYAPQAEMDVQSGEAFLTEAGPADRSAAAAISRVTGVTPEQNTGGGTSDARFIARHCPVAEFGLVGASMHQADECVPVEELRQLAASLRSVDRRHLRMILRGLLLLARGGRAGMKEFDNSADALAASLAPLIAFPLVGAALRLWRAWHRR